MSADEVYDRATIEARCVCQRTSTAHKSGNKMKAKKTSLTYRQRKQWRLIMDSAASPL